MHASPRRTEPPGHCSTGGWSIGAVQSPESVNVKPGGQTDWGEATARCSQLLPPRSNPGGHVADFPKMTK